MERALRALLRMIRVPMFESNRRRPALALEVIRSAAEALARLPDPVRTRLSVRIEALRFLPTPPQAWRCGDSYRLRLGEHWIAFRFDPQDAKVVVHAVGERASVHH